MLATASGNSEVELKAHVGRKRADGGFFWLKEQRFLLDV